MLDYFQIKGGKTLRGSVDVNGAKNSTLPLLALSIVSSKTFKLSNVPNVADVRTFLKLLEFLGASSDFDISNKIVKINSSQLNKTQAVYDIVKTMRASILVLAPLLARFGHCEVSLPGGCAIGQRPVDLHIKALELMGADISIKKGYIVATAKNGLQGTKIVFDKATVTGSENIIVAAALANGVSTLINVAKEPEVIQLCEVLVKSGINIKGIGTNRLEITGINKNLLDLCSAQIIPDRIEAGTYLCAGAITNSKITIKKANPLHLEAVITKLEQMGFVIDIDNDNITINPTKKIKHTHITTAEYPGFPTDMQAQFMALCSIASGASIIDERLFENRFMHASELVRMGADISIKGSVATIEGKSNLEPTDLMATDLRASSALIIAALATKGVSNIHRIYHLDRGYENLETKLNSLGADITRLKELKP